MNTHNNAEFSLSRRDALKTLGAGAALLGLGLVGSQRLAAQGAEGVSANVMKGPFMLPPLGFAYDALEPHIDAKTMEIHHTKHHQAYITAANKALESQADLRALEAPDLLEQLDKAPEAIRTTLRNNVGGHVNHTFFWTILSPKGGGEPKGRLGGAIKDQFGGFDEFKKQFGEAASKRFGSGWAWLVLKNEKLAIISTPNQDSPLMDRAIPLVGLDVWEHAYYLKYQNRRADYVNAFWNVVDWDKANEYYRSVP